jgi:predicted ATP-grasp superfamily ATP-dependent carboligase
MAKPTAVVMNMFYTGLGIARSLGERGIPVVGLTAERGLYGNFSRYAKTRVCPDSKREPEALLAYLIELGKSLGQRGVIFPTRDHDLVFLDCYRTELAPWYSIVCPEPGVLEFCLNKWETYLWAQRTDVPTPKAWVIENESDLAGLLDEVTYPCVLKPLAAHQWRTGRNWMLVGGRKAIPLLNRSELSAEYAVTSQAVQQVLVQEMIPGNDDCLVTVCCYFDRELNCVAAFNTRKLAQTPEQFGTGCILQAAHCPELLEPTVRLLSGMRFTGIAEVEYKWDAVNRQYRLIEINPRPWDQHRLGNTCGVDLIYLAYCDHAGLPLPSFETKRSEDKWIAEDALALEALWMVPGRDPKLRALLRLARGRRIYAIWSPRDPLPLIAYLGLRFIPQVVGIVFRSIWSRVSRGLRPKRSTTAEHAAYGAKLQRGGTNG